MTDATERRPHPPLYLSTRLPVGHTLVPDHEFLNGECHAVSKY